MACQTRRDRPGRAGHHDRGEVALEAVGHIGLGLVGAGRVGPVELVGHRVLVGARRERPAGRAGVGLVEVGRVDRGRGARLQVGEAGVVAGHEHLGVVGPIGVRPRPWRRRRWSTRAGRGRRCRASPPVPRSHRWCSRSARPRCSPGWRSPRRGRGCRRCGSASRSRPSRACPWPGRWPGTAPAAGPGPQVPAASPAAVAGGRLAGQVQLAVLVLDGAAVVEQLVQAERRGRLTGRAGARSRSPGSGWTSPPR